MASTVSFWSTGLKHTDNFIATCHYKMGQLNERTEQINLYQHCLMRGLIDHTFRAISHRKTGPLNSWNKVIGIKANVQQISIPARTEVVFSS